MATEGLKLGETTVGDDPVALFKAWLVEAEDSEVNDANAMSLATVDENDLPDVRMVLLKGCDERGFVFYTNFESAKGRQLLDGRKAALCFHWKSRRRQVRVRGPVEIVTDEEADAYYASRPRGSRIGAWASDQSRPLADRRVLEEKVAKLSDSFGEREIERPPHWSGFRLIPIQIEFWQDRRDRLHDRAVFRRGSSSKSWRLERLYP